MANAPDKPARCRAPAGPVATFGDLMGSGEKWAWLHCNSRDCHHSVALPFAPFAIRWGVEAPLTTTVRRKFRCSHCGEMTSTITMPSWNVYSGEFLTFPIQKGLQVIEPHAWLGSMCNLYSLTKTRDYVRGLAKALRDLTGNQPPLPGIFPDYESPHRSLPGWRTCNRKCALGHAVARIRPEGAELRSGHHKCSQCTIPPLAALARCGTPLRRAVYQFLRK